MSEPRLAAEILPYKVPALVSGVPVPAVRIVGRGLPSTTGIVDVGVDLTEDAQVEDQGPFPSWFFGVATDAHSLVAGEGVLPVVPSLSSFDITVPAGSWVSGLYVEAWEAWWATKGPEVLVAITIVEAWGVNYESEVLVLIPSPPGNPIGNDLSILARGMSAAVRRRRRALTR